MYRFYLETRERSRSTEIFQTSGKEILSYVKNLSQTDHLEILHGMIIMRIVDSYFKITLFDDTEKMSDLCSMTNIYSMTVLELYDINTQKVRAKLTNFKYEAKDDQEVITSWHRSCSKPNLNKRRKFLPNNFGNCLISIVKAFKLGLSAFWRDSSLITMTRGKDCFGLPAPIPPRPQSRLSTCIFTPNRR